VAVGGRRGEAEPDVGLREPTGDVGEERDPDDGRGGPADPQPAAPAGAQAAAGPGADDQQEPHDQNELRDVGGDDRPEPPGPGVGGDEHRDRRHREPGRDREQRREEVARRRNLGAAPGQEHRHQHDDRQPAQAIAVQLPEQLPLGERREAPQAWRQQREEAEHRKPRDR
jgi:hypothetical protein